jgi:hypothetical protein
MKEYLHANAQIVRDTAARLGVDAQYDEAGVLWLDGFISDRSRGNAPTPRQSSKTSLVAVFVTWFT